MGTYSSILAWRIPWAEESGGLQSMGSQRVRPLTSHTELFTNHVIFVRVTFSTWSDCSNL